MKLDLEDGRVLSLPDEMTDESARQFKRLILVSEERAATAESQVRLLQDEMAAMRQQFAGLVAGRADDQATIAAIHQMRAALEAGLKEVARICGADRVLVPDEFGTVSRARIDK